MAAVQPLGVFEAKVQEWRPQRQAVQKTEKVFAHTFARRSDPLTVGARHSWTLPRLLSITT
jgi:hypothetical protein